MLQDFKCELHEHRLAGAAHLEVHLIRPRQLSQAASLVWRNRDAEELCRYVEVYPPVKFRSMGIATRQWTGVQHNLVDED